MKLKFNKVSEDTANKQLKGFQVDEYEKEAREFLRDTETDLEIKFLYCGKHFTDDKEDRNIYLCRLSNNAGEYVFNFGDSIANTRKISGQMPSPTDWKYKPNAYSVLACLNTDFSEDFDDFCAKYGYEKHDFDNEEGNFVNESALRTYRAVQEETAAINRLFNDTEIERLNEIC